MLSASFKSIIKTGRNFVGFLLMFTLLSALNVSATETPCEKPCDTTVWFVNIYPGQEIYELEGHSALRIKTCDDDVAINYGMFNFNEPNFVYRFVKGETDYMVGAIPWNTFEREYRSMGRRMVAHKLNLTSGQKEKLIRLIEVNLRPENRVYRYNYVLDNCATRPLRMVELAVGDTLILPEPASVKAATFRDFMRYYHRNYPWYQLGIDLALGKGIDRPVTVREKSFAPVVLDEQIVQAKIGLDGGLNLVTDTEVFNDTPADGVVMDATPWFLTPDFVFWFVVIILSIYALYKVLKYKSFPRLVCSIMLTANGLLGLLVTFLIVISVHEATSPNANILWLNPLCFIPAIGLWIKKAKKFNIWCFFINFVLLFILIILWIFGYQSPNPAFVPLVLFDILMSALYIYSTCEKVKAEKNKLQS